MPFPLQTFTKSKWLAFTATLTAKITHHNPVVVVEGCDMMRRLLTTRVSVGAFLEEGLFLQHLLDVIVGSSQLERPPTALDSEMLDALFRCLWLIVDLMTSLISDGDPYYSLLVVARASHVFMTIGKVMQVKSRLYFGKCCHNALTLLSAPLTMPFKTSALEGEDTIRTNATLHAHVNHLKDLCLQLPSALAELASTTRTMSDASSDPVVQAAASMVCTAADRTLRAVQRHLAPSAEESSIFNSSTENALDGATCRPLTREDVTRTLGSFTACKSHHEFFEAMNRLWCVTVAGRGIVADMVTVSTTTSLFRFLTVSPRSSLDSILFTSILGWVGYLSMTEPLEPAFHDLVQRTVAEHFLPSCATLLSGTTTVTPSEIQPKKPFIHSVGNLSEQFLNQSSPQATLNNSSTVPAVVVKPNSTLMSLLSFLVVSERSASPASMAQWIRAGLFAVIESAIRMAFDVSSILVDAPTNVDGALSDESYLQCAMNSASTEVTTIAVTGCKLFASILSDFDDLLHTEFTQETSALVEVMLPLLLRILIRNPSLSAADENKTGSILHHVPRCHRASRATSLGECAAGAIDACLSMMDAVDMDASKLREILGLVPAISRATKKSVIPHLRASTYRFLIRVCNNPSQLVLITRETPSMISGAIQCVLRVDADAPQWECAAAAEWLTQVIHIASLDASTEQSFDLGKTALPLQLLKIITTLPLSYTSAAMLRLVIALFEQQQRLLTRYGFNADTPAVGCNSLAPLGRKSLNLWSHLIHTASHANRSLMKVCETIVPIRTATKDGVARCLAVFEDIAAQMAYTTAVAKGVAYVVTVDAQHRDGFSDALMCELIESCLRLPTPAAIQEMVCIRFGVTCTATSLLRKAFDVMISSSMALSSVWYSTSSLIPFEALPHTLVMSAVDLMSNGTVSVTTRNHVSRLINSIHTIPNQPTLVQSCSELSGALFEASLTLLPSEAPSMTAMRCRLLAEHPGASSAAVATGWIKDNVIVPLSKVAQMIHGKHMDLDNPKEKDIFLNLISYMASFFSNDQCAELPHALIQLCASSWLTLLKHEKSRSTSLRCVPFICRSAEGRKVALYEATLLGDPSHRCCFAYIAQLAFPSPLVPESRRPKVAQSDVAAVLAGISSAISLQTDELARIMVKVRSLEAIEHSINESDRTRRAVSTPYLRVLSALSFSADVQLWIAQRSELMTSVLTIATEQPMSENGSLALLIVRNLCFHPNLKTQMCQDARVLFALRSALLCQGTSTDPRHLGDPFQAVTVALEPSEETLRRQELAAKSLWALVHNNERGKAYVRGALQKNPGPRVTPGSGLAMKLSIPQYEYSGAELKDFAAMVGESLQALTEMELLVAT